jgi:DNA polymerase (family 10)
VLSTCGKHGVAVEINAHPWRLDLDWRWHQAALGVGCMMSINPDAHSAISTFPDMAVGSAYTSSFSRHAQRSLALRPAHSRCHQFVTR